MFKLKLKKFLKDCEDLEYFRKCPNDFNFWYWCLCHLYLTLPYLICFILGYLYK